MEQRALDYQFWEILACLTCESRLPCPLLIHSISKSNEQWNVRSWITKSPDANTTAYRFLQEQCSLAWTRPIGSFKLLSRLCTVNTDSIARAFQNGAQIIRVLWVKAGTCLQLFYNPNENGRKFSSWCKFTFWVYIFNLSSFYCRLVIIKISPAAHMVIKDNHFTDVEPASNTLKGTIGFYCD